MDGEHGVIPGLAPVDAVRADAVPAGRARPGQAPGRSRTERRSPLGRASAATVPAADRPVARVVVDTPLAHLDRAFDYLVPAEMAGAAVPGSRVRVRFAGRLVDGFILDRADRSEHTGRLAPLARSVSAEPVLAEPIARLARAVADRYAGTLADVLRLAVPPRHGRAEAEAGPADAGPGADVGAKVDSRGSDGPAAAAACSVAGSVPVAGSAPDAGAGASAGPTAGGKRVPGTAGWGRYAGGPDLLAALRGGRSPRTVWWAPPGAEWPTMIADAVAATVASGRGVLVVVPDHRDADRVAQAWGARSGAECVTLRADVGPAERYRRFLAVRRGRARVVVGTRAAVFAPVADLGLVVVWDDGDDLHAEPRAPYPHTRDVAVLRAREEGCAVLIGGFSPSVDAVALVRVGWAGRLALPRDAVRGLAPRVEAVGSDFEASIDPAARAARLPSLAVRTARSALTGGAPVLVQVPRRGYQPALACADCRRPARCRHCSGPLGRAAVEATPTCRWCGRPAPALDRRPAGAARGAWHCPSCGGDLLRVTVVGDRRTAEELGRAFPGVPVRTSGRDEVLASVPAEPVLVIATPGAEPVAEGGYGAVLLLDGWALLGRPDLRAGEETLRRWLGAAALARPSSHGGVVVVAADLGLGPVQALLRWDPGHFVAREVSERAEFGFPPASRVAAVEGRPGVLADLLAVAELPAGAEVLGPVPAPPRAAGPSGGGATAPSLDDRKVGAGGDLTAETVAEEENERLIIRVRREQGSALAGALHAARGALDARRAGRLRVQLDPLELG